MTARSCWWKVLLILCLSATAVQAQDLQVELASGSRLWVEGRSNVSGFTCRATVFDGEATRHAERVAVRLRVPTNALDCGHPQMNADLRAALQAERYPAITFVLVEARPAGDASVLVRGLVRLAGQGRIVQFTAQATPTEEGYRVAGRVPLNMRDFGVTPPQALLGLVRVRPEIVVGFDLDVRARERAASLGEYGAERIGDGQHARPERNRQGRVGF